MNGSERADILDALAEVLEARASESPRNSYVASLYAQPDKLLKKIGEEAAETIIAAKNGGPKELVHEIADLWFHTLVLLTHHGLNHGDVLAELRKRFGTGGYAEKAARKAAPPPNGP